MGVGPVERPSRSRHPRGALRRGRPALRGRGRALPAPLGRLPPRAGGDGALAVPPPPPDLPPPPRPPRRSVRGFACASTPPLRACPPSPRAARGGTTPREP